MNGKNFYRTLLLLSIIFIGRTPQVISQNKIEGFWDCRVEYQCGWGWKNSDASILLSPSFNGEYNGFLMGGELKINHPFDNDDFSFEISGQAE